jgi:cytochrome c oxidase assembly protein subunit 15
MTPARVALHRYALLWSASTVFLLLAGAFVTSTGSGLAVPDWPLSYGMVFPPMVGGIFYEHGHRLVAATIGLMTIGFALFARLVEPRSWVRKLAYFALFLVCFQGALGGLTVLLLLPPAVSTLHAFTAQTFFSTTVILVLATSRAWIEEPAIPFASSPARGPFSTVKLAFVTTGAFFLQLVLGATMRHNQAGLAIPDFPLHFGKLLPPTWTTPITLHFAHRTFAYVVATLAIVLAAGVLRDFPTRLRWTRFATLLGGLVLVQFALGAAVVWFARPPWLASVHLVVGALCLGTSVALSAEIVRALRAARSPLGNPAPTLSGKALA